MLCEIKARTKNLRPCLHLDLGALNFKYAIVHLLLVHILAFLDLQLDE